MKDEPAQVEDLAIGVATVHDPREVKHLRSIEHLRPETLLQSLLLSFESSGRLNEVEVGKDSDELGETVGGKGGEGFEGFLQEKEGELRLRETRDRKTHHLETETSVNHHENQISNLGDIDHRSEVVRDLDEGKAAVLACVEKG